MRDTQDQTSADGPLSNDDFYLPAVTMPPNLGRVEEVVSDLFDFHGVVPIPDSYNE